jgi:hypothetical protein
MLKNALVHIDHVERAVRAGIKIHGTEALVRGG